MKEEGQRGLSLAAMTDITSEIAALRERASFFRKQRRSDAELYTVLAKCLSICERCDRDPALLEVLKEDHLNSVASEGRRYFESGADAPLVIGRMVFGGGQNRAASWRYTACLREAQKRQVSSSDLVSFLKEEGGLNALFRARPVEARTSATKTLHLTHRVRMSKSGNFTLTLRRNDRGYFDVLAAQGAEIED